MIAIVGVEYGESGTSQVVLLTLQSSSEGINASIYVSVIENDERIRAIPFRNVHNAGYTQSIGKIGYLISFIRRIDFEDLHKLELGSCWYMNKIVGKGNFGNFRHCIDLLSFIGRSS